MSAGIAVADASPLIAFHQVDRLELLRGLFLQVLVPPIVAREVAPSLGKLPHWIEVREIFAIPAIRRRIDPGERAAIALALHVAADFVILDDLAGRTTAAELGLPAIGSLGLLVRAKRGELLSEVQPVMNAMIANGLLASERVRREILEAAREE